MTINPLALPAAALMLILFAVGAAIPRSLRRLVLPAGIVLAVPGLLYVLYYTHLFDDALWFYRLRAATGSEFLAAGMGLLAGVIHRWFEPQSRSGKAALPTILLLLVFAPHAKPLLAPLNLSMLSDHCQEDVCLQSTPSTCGPASAAALLNAAGRRTSERELARECYTSSRGTEIWYLARAIRRRGFGAEFVSQSPGVAHWPTPAIAGVILRGPAGHFIALIDQTPETLTLADPLRGRLVIPKSQLTARYRFSGLFLAIRPAAPAGL